VREYKCGWNTTTERPCPPCSVTVRTAPSVARTSVVVEHPHSVRGADQFEAAAHTLEPGQPVEHRLDRRTDFRRGQQRAKRVERHVPARHREPHHSRVGLGRQLDVCHRAGVLLFPAQQPARQVGRTSPIFGSSPERFIAAVPEYADPQRGSALGQSGGARVVGAHDQCTTGSQPLDEVVEHRAVCLWAAEEIQMVGLDVGHHSHIRGVFEQ
jgi:hypothetical protein